jgi:hemin uptake protein HemP
VDITYRNETIPIIDFDKFILSSELQDNNDFEMKLTIPYTKSNEILFRIPYEDVIIDFDGADYTFKIMPDGITYDETKMYIRCVHAIAEKLNAYMTATYNVADYNPITAVMELLDDYNINYNNYAFQKARTFFTGINETMDIVFIYEPGNKMRLCDFLAEILKRLACVLVIDYKNNEVTLHNFIDTPINYNSTIYGVTNGLLGFWNFKEGNGTFFDNINNYATYKGTVDLTWATWTADGISTSKL